MNTDEATLSKETTHLIESATKALDTLTAMLAHPNEDTRMRAASIILNYYIQFTNYPFIDPTA